MKIELTDKYENTLNLKVQHLPIHRLFTKSLRFTRHSWFLGSEPRKMNKSKLHRAGISAIGFKLNIKDYSTHFWQPALDMGPNDSSYWEERKKTFNYHLIVTFRSYFCPIANLLSINKGISSTEMSTHPCQVDGLPFLFSYSLLCWALLKNLSHPIAVISLQKNISIFTKCHGSGGGLALSSSSSLKPVERSI